MHIAVNGGSEQLDSAESSVTEVEEEEEEEVGTDPQSPLTAAFPVPVRGGHVETYRSTTLAVSCNTGSKRGNLLTTTSHLNFAGADGELSAPSDAGRDPIQVKSLLLLYIRTRAETTRNLMTQKL